MAGKDVGELRADREKIERSGRNVDGRLSGYREETRCESWEYCEMDDRVARTLCERPSDQIWWTIESCGTTRKSFFEMPGEHRCGRLNAAPTKTNTLEEGRTGSARMLR